MQPNVITSLLNINAQFYQTFATSFAATRRRIQPGVRHILNQLPRHGCWLDLGCGSGNLAVEWVLSAKTGVYHGLDFSSGLLAEAHKVIEPLQHPDLSILFDQIDLSSPDWQKSVTGQPWDGALAFAVLHHLPSELLRREVLSTVRALLHPGGFFIHSEWQFQNSPKLLARSQPWNLVNLESGELEEGDTLLDWRQTAPGQPEQRGLRYVHLFTTSELENLASKCGFTITDQFESDGEGGRLGLYQVWQAV
jgi:SAM-dependent methyltransferase